MDVPYSTGPFFDHYPRVLTGLLPASPALQGGEASHIDLAETAGRSLLDHSLSIFALKGFSTTKNFSVFNASHTTYLYEGDM